MRLFWLRCFLLALFFFGATRFYYRLTDDVRIANIQYDFAKLPKWEGKPLTDFEQERIQALLRQPFTYLGKGAQSYAFGSQDGQVVLKFFKFKHLRPLWFSPYLLWVPYLGDYFENQDVKKEYKLTSVFQGYQIAARHHFADSGLLLLHFAPTEKIWGEVTLIDKIGLKRTLDLDQTIFLLQLQVKTLRNVMIELLDRGEVALAKKRLIQVIDLYQSEYQKGIYDRDHGVFHNVGFAGEIPIHLDVGKMSELEEIKDPKVWSVDLDKIVSKMDVWLKQRYPKQHAEIMDHVTAKVERCLSQAQAEFD